MFDRLFRRMTVIAVAGMLAAAAWGQAPKAPAVKDQGEYDLTQAIQKATDPAKKLDLLHQWEQKYPDSDFKGPRTVMVIQTEGALANAGLQPNATPAALDAAQKAAQDLADNLDKYFAVENKPAAVSEQQWNGVKTSVSLTAHTVLATVAMGKKTPEGDATAEAEYKKVLAAADSGATAYQLGVLILREKKIDRIPEALYYIAHAISVTGPMALNPAGQKAAQDYLSKAYSGYHGDTTGLDDLTKLAAASPNPPAGFTIKSVTELDKEKQGDIAKFNAEHPDIALWRTIKAALTAPDGDSYFDSSVKDAEIPPQDGPFQMFTAKVVEQRSPGELIVNVDNAAGDASLQFDPPLKGTIDPGTEIKFKGAVDSFTKDPYMLTFKDEGKEDVSGIPDTAFPSEAPAKKRVPKKKK